MNCPYCGEPVELQVDEEGGRHQRYVEDCPVCCRPWQVEVTEGLDGQWNATLRTTDE
ncbi:MAG: CPXCG motif-containing cysteine-rich protein [Gemmatimonadetes bacterium]|nr:CPXCG motif-containing cysteine-rich protein [Gemmatimonadota bacterium]